MASIPIESPAAIRQLAPGDREPTVRMAASRILASLDAIESDPCPPGADAEAARARRIFAHRTRLRHLVSLAKLYSLTIQPAAVERAATHRKASR